MKVWLKPCPFCGGKATIITNPDYPGMYYAECANYGVCIVAPRAFGGLSPEEAAAGWNERAENAGEKRKMRIMLDDFAIIPERAHSSDAGLDIKTPEEITVRGWSSAVIDTGVHVELPPGTTGFLKSKSGLNMKHCITSDGVIDEGYTGSIKVRLYNHGSESYTFKRGDKITQLVILPVNIPDELEVVDVLKETDRGSNGFGSSGR